MSFNFTLQSGRDKGFIEKLTKIFKNHIEQFVNNNFKSLNSRLTKLEDKVELMNKRIGNIDSANPEAQKLN